jgi:hypothetical protein
MGLGLALGGGYDAAPGATAWSGSRASGGGNEGRVIPGPAQPSTKEAGAIARIELSLGERGHSHYSETQP